MAYKSNDDVKRILVVDDHPLICEGLARVINDEADMIVCGAAHDIDTAMSHIAERIPHAVIIDISLKDFSGIDLIRAIKTIYPDIPLLVYSMHDEFAVAARIINAGARGYVMKDQNPEVIISALRKVLNGKMYFSEKVAVKLIDKIVVAADKM